MNVMQSLVDFKQNLQQQAHPAVKAAAALGAAQPTARPLAAVPADTGSSSSSSSSDSTTITANDFLQLLVAEMKNQDPTADQDPNDYIDQLVQVNSLQQLIAINQDLSAEQRERPAARPIGPTSTSEGGGSATLRDRPRNSLVRWPELRRRPWRLRSFPTPLLWGSCQPRIRFQPPGRRQRRFRDRSRAGVPSAPGHRRSCDAHRRLGSLARHHRRYEVTNRHHQGYDLRTQAEIKST